MIKRSEDYFEGRRAATLDAVAFLEASAKNLASIAETPAAAAEGIKARELARMRGEPVERRST